jgi:hypothetical protein
VPLWETERESEDIARLFVPELEAQALSADQQGAAGRRMKAVDETSRAGSRSWVEVTAWR